MSLRKKLANWLTHDLLENLEYKNSLLTTRAANAESHAQELRAKNTGLFFGLVEIRNMMTEKGNATVRRMAARASQALGE